LYGYWAFSVGDLTVWNSMPEDMRDPKWSVNCYRQLLKTFLLCSTSVSRTLLEVCYEDVFYKFTFDIW